jgi:hypothetical protein
MRAAILVYDTMSLNNIVTLGNYSQKLRPVSMYGSVFTGSML